MTWWHTILQALWPFLPAYAANMAPPIVAKLWPSWSSPIDGGRVAADGRRILGKGKTWRGLAGGALFGGLVALGMGLAAPHWDFISGLDFGLNGSGGEGAPGPDAPAGCGPGAGDGTGAGTGTGTGTGSGDGTGGGGGMGGNCPSAPWQVFLFGAVVGAFALAGDAAKSYFKRRRGKEGGAPWVLFDQLDFVVAGLAGMLVASPLLPPGWVWQALTDDWRTLATLLLLTPVLHVAVNGLGYLLRLKKVPW